MKAPQSAAWVLLALILTSTTAIAQWASPELKQTYEARQPPPPPPKSNFDREAEAYAKASQQAPEVWGDVRYGPILRGYWQQRLDVASKLDRGDISVAAATALNEAGRLQTEAAMRAASYQATAEMLKDWQQQRTNQAIQDEAAAAARQRRDEAFAAGVRALTGQSIAPAPTTIVITPAPRPPPQPTCVTHYEVPRGWVCN